jgi:membrane-associated phospholipid phosphatase
MQTKYSTNENHMVWLLNILITLKFLFFISILCFIRLQLCSQNIDVKILSGIYSDSSSTKDKGAKILSTSVAPLSIFAPAAMLVIGLLKKDSVLIHKGLGATGAILLTTLVTNGLKYGVNRTRPYNEYPLLFHAKTRTNQYSFPSGHTSSAFTTATSLSLVFPKWYVIAPSYLWACSVSYSRMYLGVHYPTDVLAGAIIGTACSFLSFKIEKWINSRKQHR